MNVLPKSKLVTISILLLICGVLFYCAMSKNEFMSLSFAGVVSVVLILLHEYDARLRRCPPVILFSLIGTCSYSLYLLHVPLWPFVAIFVRNLVPLSPEISKPLVLIPGIIILSFSWYLFFERPPAQRSVIGCLFSPFSTLFSGLNFVRVFVS